MATMECSHASERQSPRTSFNPSAIPSAPPLSLSANAPTSQNVTPIDHEPDLIDLAGERLFSGNASGVVARGDHHSTRRSGFDHLDQAPEGIDGQMLQDELLGSLGEARQAFALALSSLLQPYLSHTPQQRSSVVAEPGSMMIPSTPPAIPFSNPFVDPSAILAPFRRQSLALAPPSTSVSRRSSTVLPSTSTSFESSETLLSTLVQSLEQRTSSAASSGMLSTETDSPLAYRRLSTGTSPRTTLLEELHSQIEICARDLPPIDAEMARSLASLLICIDRLANLSVMLNGLSNLEEDPWQNRAVGAAREVERAERDLLWGRVDDLSDRVRTLTRQRQQDAGGSPAEAEDTSVPTIRSSRRSLDNCSWSPRSRDVAWDAASLSSLPSYNQEPGMSSPTLPPSYFNKYHLHDEKEEGCDPDVSSLLPTQSSSQQDLIAGTAFTVDPPTRRLRKVSSLQGEKMQRDLDCVSQAIERLYIVSPQLANQRVEPDRRVLRERQLAKLGNAIERLSQGRLNDQRASSLPPAIQEPETQAERSRRERDAVDKLIERIDKAASRTLADQRVELNGKRRAFLPDAESKTFDPLFDPREAKRREYILEHTGKGRLAGQDAILNPSGLTEPFPRPPPGLNDSMTATEFFSEEIRNPSCATIQPADAALRKKTSSKNLFQSQKVGTEEPPIARRGSLRIGMLKSFGSRRGSTADVRIDTGTSDGSRSAALGPIEILDIPEFDWITEESRNLGSLIVTFWARTSSGCSSNEPLEVVSIEAESIVVGSTRGGPASRLSLPSKVIPQEALVTSSGPFYEVKLVTTPPSPTKSRADLEVHVPLSTAELRKSLPVSFVCTICHTEIVNASLVTRYNALPSEHWAELLDAWMCHPDQTLSQDLVSKGRGIKPRTDEGLVGTSYILFPREITKCWGTPEGTSPIRSANDDNLLPARCTCCSTLVGYHVESISHSDADPTSFRLLKYATYPLLRASSSERYSEYSLSCHITAELLEIGQAHACHRFVLEDLEEEVPRLLLWFFNPAIRVAFSTSSSFVDNPRALRGDSATLKQSNSENDTQTNELVHRSMNAVKVFYSVIQGAEDAHYQNFVENKTETIHYPLSIVTQLTKLVQASTLVYPPAKRHFGAFQIGFLERI